MKKCKNYFLYFFYCTLFFSCTGKKEPVQNENEEMFHYSELKIRDPYVFYDPVSDAYYIHANKKPYLEVYKSKDLLNWHSLGYSFTPEEDFWGKEAFWAPDLFYYNGKYYLFVTFEAEDVNEGKKGTSVLVSAKPEGPFEPLVNKPVTPEGWTCLDATLYIDEDKQPWLVFCREWAEVVDGEVWVQKLTNDLRNTVGEPILLFKAGDARWTETVLNHESDIRGYVTDGPIVYRANNGELVIIWSSFDAEGKYAIGVVRSSNGNFSGTWTHDEIPLNTDNGGHCMLFEKEGKNYISYHAPNVEEPGVVIREFHDDNGKLFLGENY